ncbi:MAG: hypothetical protein IPL84_00560 [Chitinophagaceae bacterium]|nr:hypothetical protein [Chitinophagaceae bacterium]
MKAAIKKAIPKKAATKKPLVKKTVSKKPLSKKTTVPKAPVAGTVAAGQWDDVLAKTANVTTTNAPEVAMPGGEANEPGSVTDPIRAFDKHAAEKAMAKGNPQSGIKLSSTGKGSIKPAGKKPLWRK